MKTIGNMVERINRRGLMFFNIVLLSLAMLSVNLWQTGTKIFDKSDFENVVLEGNACHVGHAVFASGVCGADDNSVCGAGRNSVCGAGDNSVCGAGRNSVCGAGDNSVYGAGDNGKIECSLHLAAELFSTTFQNYDIPLQVNASSLGQNVNTARSGCWQWIIKRVQPAPKKQSYAGYGFAVADSRPVKVKYIYSTCNLRI